MHRFQSMTTKQIETTTYNKHPKTINSQNQHLNSQTTTETSPQSLVVPQIIKQLTRENSQHA